MMDTRGAWRLGKIALLLLGLMAIGAQRAAGGAEPFVLGTVTVLGERFRAGELDEDAVASWIGQDEIRLFNRDDIGAALNLLSGVTLSTNSRNEAMIAVRGFDARQVPLFIDGIPVYVPYDGYVDFNRFTTADLAAIQVAKGFSSVAYGANTLGGAINLVSRKPVEVIEGDVTVGAGSGQERKTAVNFGSNRGPWYLQAGASWLEADGMPLSSGFRPTATENGGQRNNGFREDRKLSFKIGVTPREGDEYAVSYYRQDGEKGQPPSTDPAVARYWRWPYWDKESLYFVSRTTLGESASLDVRLYHDRFDNEVNSYTDDTYSTLRTSGRGSVGTGRSIYRDRTSGGSVALESGRIAAHTLRIVGHYKDDEHQEFDANGLENTNFVDRLLSLGVEDNIRFTASTAVSIGVAHHELRPDTVFSLGNPYSLPGKQSATDAQVGLFHDASAATRFYATIARKSRLPTLKDRYSQRLGRFIENPALRAESSVNYEIGYRGSPWTGGEVEAAAFFSDISDRIQAVRNVSGILSQMQNIGKVRASGVELGLRADLAGRFEVGGHYTFTDLDNRSDPTTRLTDVPEHKFTGHALWHATGFLDVLLFVEHDSARWASDTVELAGFTTLDLTVSARPRKGMWFEAGVANLADRNYSLADGFPAAGRRWFVNAGWKF
ncbi:MAG: Vitamin B12 transporter BtuB [Steroidobacteraceae bacterium]|nr:Vitamin B12 transporter BtuB [Steroidobacteraceae bacterium]